MSQTIATGPLKGLTMDAVLAETKQAAIENRKPYFPQAETGHILAETPATPSPGDVFTASDLGSELVTGSEWYTVPGSRKRLCVHAISGEDLADIMAWTALQAEPSASDAGQLSRAVSQQELTQIGQIYQVIKACRDGGDRSAKRVFGRGDYHAVRRNLSYVAIRDICQISERLSGSGEQIGAGVRVFFGHVRQCLRTCASTCATSADSPPGLLDTLTRLESLASRAEKRGTWDSGMSAELEA
jgi:hypothetical protein